MNARTTARPAATTGGRSPLRPARRGATVVLVTAVLTALALTGCRGGAQGASGSAGGGDVATPVATSTATPGGIGSTGGSGGPGSGDLKAVDDDLKSLSSADAAVGNDLGAAASEGAQPDNG